MTSGLPQAPSRPRPSDRLRLVEDVIVDLDGSDVFLLHPHLPRWALTNSFGHSLARLMDGTLSGNDIACLLTSLFDGLDPSRALADVMDFAGQLAEAGLLESHPPDPGGLPRRHQEPRRLNIYLTEECNLRCRHCFVVEGKMHRPTLSTAEIERLIDAHTQRHPGALVVFTGGEPLLRSDCIPLVRHAANRTPHVSVNTNGLLVDDSVFDALRDIPGLFLQISLDGVTADLHDALRGKGTFEKTWAVLERLSEAGLGRQIRTSTTLTRCTVEQIRAFIHRVEPLGLGQMRFLMLNRLKAAETWWDEIAPDPEELKAIYRFLLLEVPRISPPLRTPISGDMPGFVPRPDPTGHPWCPMGKTSIVDSLGNAYTCPILHKPEYRVGRLGDDDLDVLEDGPRTRALRDQMLSRRHRIAECRTCAWRNFCQGGCQGTMELRTGSTFATDGFCDFRRELYREHARREG